METDTISFAEVGEGEERASDGRFEARLIIMDDDTAKRSVKKHMDASSFAEGRWPRESAPHGAAKTRAFLNACVIVNQAIGTQNL